MSLGDAFDPLDLRKAIEEVLPGEFSAFGETPEPRYLYVPKRHSQALSPDHGLVVGIRGAGKSVWWAALQVPAHRQVVAAALPELVLEDVTRVSAGFGEKPRPDDYPDRRTLQHLLGEGYDPSDIWRTVVARHTWGQTGELQTLETWQAKLDWLRGHSEQAARAFQQYDSELGAQKHLILFDALDLAASSWVDLTRLLRGLLQTLLEFRAYRSIRAKAFVRPDMLEDPEVTAFRDASKVEASRVELRWGVTDLYGLLFQYLGNAPAGGADFRRGCELLGTGPWIESVDRWNLPKRLREEEATQRQVFHAITGELMGSESKRGFPYTWLPNHLADAAGQVSPRSFLAALHAAAAREAAEKDRYALHYEGIKRGVQEASRIRVGEIRENFPWIVQLMEPLRGLTIPCPFSEIEDRWDKAGAVEKIRSMPQEDRQALPPRNLQQGPAGLKRDLLDLALFSERKDGRINMPDVYRVGFGLGRRGGVKPIR